MKGNPVRLTCAFALGAGTLFAEPVWDLGTFKTTARLAADNPFVRHHPLSASALTPTEALLRVPGLATFEGFGGIDPPRLSVRGSGLQSAPMGRGLLLVTGGVPLNFADGSFHLPLIEPRFFERVSLDSMPLPTALGGRLDWLPAFPAPESIRVTLSAGGHRTFAGLLAVSKGANEEDLHFSGALAHIRSDGWREHSDYERTSLLGIVSYAHGPTRSRLQIYASNPRFAIPGPLTEENALRFPRTLSPAVRRDRPYRKTNYARLAHTTTMALAGGSFLEATVAAALVDDRFVQLLPNGISTNRGYEGFAAFAWTRPSESLTIGETRFHAQAAVARREALRFRNDGGREGAQIGDNRFRPLTLVGGARQRWNFGPSLEGALQVDGILAERRIDERFPISPERPSSALPLRETHLAPRADLLWRTPFLMDLGLAVSRQYEPPTFDDLLWTSGPLNARWLQSAPLRSQRADTVEMVFQKESLRNRWALSLYESRWRGELLRMVDAGGNARGTVNADHTQRRGATISLEHTVYEKMDTALRLWTHYSWQALRFRNDPVYGNRRLAGAAPHTFAGGVEVEAFGGASFHLGGRGTSGRTYVDHMNGRAHGGSFITFLQAGFRIPGAGNVSLRIDNLFDRRHLASTAGVLDEVAPGAEPVVFLPGSPRRISVDFRRSW